MKQHPIWIFSIISASFIVGNILGHTFIDFRRNLQEKPSWIAYLFIPSFRYVWGYVLLAILFIIVYWHASKLINYQFGDLREGHKGTNRFSTDDEIKLAYKAVPYIPEYDDKGNLKFYEGKAGSLIARIGEMAYIDISDSHTIAVGRTRSGKDETKVLPDLDLLSRSEEQPHIICTTVKYETLEKTKIELEQRGYKVEVLNLIDLDYSFGFNCLELIKDAYIAGDIDEADELCKTFTHPLYDDPHAKEKIWGELSMALVNACILALCHEFTRPELKEKRPEMITMSALVNMLIQLSGTYQLDRESRFKLDEYFNSLPLDNPARQEYAPIGMTTGQMRSSVLGTTLSKLQKFASPKVTCMMNRTTFHFEKLTQSDQPYCIFILLPDFTQTNYIIATTWIEQCYYYLSKYASLHGDRLPKRVHFKLNEFGNMPAFSSLSSMVSVGAGRGMLFDFYLQDTKQFKIVYGQDIADFISTQVMNMIYIATSDKDTQKEYSEMLGNKEVIARSRSGHWLSLSKTINETVEQRPLMYPDELARILQGEWIVIRSKRLTDNYEHVIPYPIFNQGENRMLLAYAYLDDVFERKSYKYLNLNQHHNKNWGTHELSVFTLAIEERIKNHGSVEVRELIHRNEIINDAKEALEKPLFSQRQSTLTIEDIGGQIFESAVDKTSQSYQKVKQHIIKYLPHLLEEFEQIQSKSEFKTFTLQKYSNYFSRLLTMKEEIYG